ncbi:MAG TPA: hypothetical protein VG943_03350 [Caulobacterales bacterium]|nr:hypothetical protein [Caulobacterales bacterium]
MKKMALILAVALAACGQPAQTTTEATTTGPTGLMAEAQTKSQEELPVYGYQLLAAYQAAHADSTPVCHTVRAAESRGVIPPDVDPASIYGAHAGSLVLSVQCGAQLTRTAYDPHEHWLVVLAPGATDAQILNCADAHGNDVCPREVPRAATPATTTGTSTSTATKS